MNVAASHRAVALAALLFLASLPQPALADQVVLGSQLSGAAEKFVVHVLRCPSARAVARVPDQRVQGGRIQLAPSWTASCAPAGDAQRVLVKVETRVDGVPVARVAILVEVERQAGRPSGTAGGRPGASPHEVAATPRTAVPQAAPAPPAPVTPPAMVVHPGDSVTLILRASSGSLELQVPAVACGSAPLGGTVRVQLEGSRRNVTGRLVADRQVESELP